jgi:hypothetical protein
VPSFGGAFVFESSSVAGIFRHRLNVASDSAVCFLEFLRGDRMTSS